MPGWVFVGRVGWETLEDWAIVFERGWAKVMVVKRFHNCAFSRVILFFIPRISPSSLLGQEVARWRRRRRIRRKRRHHESQLGGPAQQWHRYYIISPQTVRETMGEYDHSSSKGGAKPYIMISISGKTLADMVLDSTRIHPLNNNRLQRIVHDILSRRKWLFLSQALSFTRHAVTFLGCSSYSFPAFD